MRLYVSFAFRNFPNNEQLGQHMDVHLYMCGICGEKFNLMKDMRSHYNAIHLGKKKKNLEDS